MLKDPDSYSGAGERGGENFRRWRRGGLTPVHERNNPLECMWEGLIGFLGGGGKGRYSRKEGKARASALSQGTASRLAGTFVWTNESGAGISCRRSGFEGGRKVEGERRKPFFDYEKQGRYSASADWLQQQCRGGKEQERDQLDKRRKRRGFQRSSSGKLHELRRRLYT